MAYVEVGAEFKGQSPSLVLVHGNLSSKEWWHDTLQGLKGYPHHILAVDMRGFGESTYSKPCERYGDWASDLVAFCGQLKVEKCMVVGWSFGGAITMKFAELAPHLVTKVLLVCSMAAHGFKIPKGDGKFCESREEMKESQMFNMMNGNITSQNVEAVRAPWRVSLFANVSDYPTEKIDMMIKSQFNQRCLLDWFYASASSDIHLDNIKVPVTEL